MPYHTHMYTYVHISISRESESCISTHLSRDHYMRWFIVWETIRKKLGYQCHLILDFLHKIRNRKAQKYTQTLGLLRSPLLQRYLWCAHIYTHTHTEHTQRQCLSEILSTHFSMYKRHLQTDLWYLFIVTRSLSRSI